MLKDIDLFKLNSIEDVMKKYSSEGPTEHLPILIGLVTGTALALSFTAYQIYHPIKTDKQTQNEILDKGLERVNKNLEKINTTLDSKLIDN